MRANKLLPRVDLIRSDENSWLLMQNRDHISDFIRQNGFWGHTEATIAKVFLANRLDSNTLDVGANVGGFTLPIAKFVSSLNGRVFSFEPQRIVFQQLCANVFLNSLDNVYTHNVALGDENCDIKIPELNYWESQNIGGFSVDRDIRKHIENEALMGENLPNKESAIHYTVKQQTLDSYRLEFTVNLIKVDVEGFELEFFVGAQETIRRNNFPPIIFELWTGKSWYEQKAAKTKRVLMDFGYNFWEFGREVLAQHPDHGVQCIIDRNDKNINLRIA